LFWKPPTIDDDATERVRDVLARELQRIRFANAFLNLLAVTIIVGYFGLLTYYWNFGLSLAAAMTMLARLPDLLWEIRTGQRVTRKNAPQGAQYLFGLVLLYGALPVVWYSLCKWPT